MHIKLRIFIVLVGIGNPQSNRLQYQIFIVRIAVRNWCVDRGHGSPHVRDYQKYINTRIEATDI